MFAITALVLFAPLQGVVADFHIGYSLRLYSNPNNSLANGSCCEDTCSSCNTILFFCFRDSFHSHEDTSRSSCFVENERDNTALFTFLPDNTPQKKAIFTGSFQLFINVIHASDIAGFQQGEGDIEVRLIDNVFLEFSNLTALPFELVSFVQTVFMEQTGDFGRVTISIGVNAICARGFNGSGCNTFCAEDSNGNINCEQVEYSVSEPLTTTMEDSTSTFGPDDTTELRVIVISVAVPVGVIIFSVFMLVGLIRGFRYLFQKLQEYEKLYMSGFKGNPTKPEQKSSVVGDTGDIDDKNRTVIVTVNVE